jgi:protease-4
MDFDQNDNLPEVGPWEKSQQSQPPGPPPPPVAPAAPPTPAKPAKKRRGWKIFWGIVLTLSVLANIALFLMLLGTVAFFAVGDQRMLHEEVIHDGPRNSKIAVISLQGVIDDENAREVRKQLKRAREDRSVKGIILRVNSPGGTISGSDQIYNEIKNKTDIPAVAFMQGVAASGGYYASVACERIVAEPTVITGSVGVIGAYVVLKELLEDKLGILPVIVKSGEKKDWPSSFRPPSEEEIQYLHDKLITPAYERFVQVIAEGRKDLLTLPEIRRLADGSIYGAQEAKDEKLVDAVGYLDEAIDQVKALAGIDKALVIEYRKPFSFADFLSSSNANMLKIDESTFYDLSTPRLLYLWTLQK